MRCIFHLRRRRLGRLKLATLIVFDICEAIGDRSSFIYCMMCVIVWHYRISWEDLNGAASDEPEFAVFSKKGDFKSTKNQTFSPFYPKTEYRAKDEIFPRLSAPINFALIRVSKGDW